MGKEEEEEWRRLTIVKMTVASLLVFSKIMTTRKTFPSPPPPLSPVMKGFCSQDDGQ